MVVVVVVVVVVIDVVVCGCHPGMHHALPAPSHTCSVSCAWHFDMQNWCVVDHETVRLVQDVDVNSVIICHSIDCCCC